MTTFATDRDVKAPTPDIGWKGLTVLGLIMLIGGALAFLNPFAASLTVEAVAGAAFFLAGVTQVWMAFSPSREDTGARVLDGILGVLLVLFALSLLFDPLGGLITLTFVVAVFFAAMGMVRVIAAFRARPRQGWGWMMASGVMSVALALVIVLGLPQSALRILGLFLAIDLTMAGISTLYLAWRAKETG